MSTVSLFKLWEKHVTLRSAVSLLLVKPLPSNNTDERQKTSTPAFGKREREGGKRGGGGGGGGGE